MVKGNCRDCAYYRTPNCSYSEDLKKGTMKSTDDCPDFYPKHEAKEGQRESQADKLIQLCQLHNPVLFHDQHQTSYAKIEQSETSVILSLRSRPFKAFLAGLLWQHEQKAPGTEALYGAINVLEAMALFEGSKYTLHNRVAPAEDGFWIDMVDEQWRAIKVTAEGWEIVGCPPILFKRYSHQLPLVEPQRGGDPWRFLDFVNIDKEDKATRLTLLCTAISYLIPDIPHPILVLYGIQGSGKTWLFRLIRKLIDPSIIDVLTLPRNERERVQQLDHHWLAFYDNVTTLAWWMSDTLCRAATGGGFSKRELYTDDADITYSFKRCVGLNGINIAAQRGDLLDRSILVGLEDIPKARRKTEKQLLAEFESCKAQILGGFLDVLVKAIQVYPSVQLKGLFRMADFTRWGCAITIALGGTKEDFIDSYETKVRMQIEEAALASPVATVLIDFMESVKEWEGTPSGLHTILLNRAKDLGISGRQKAWPKAPHVLVRQLNELAPSLKALGWEVITGIKSGATRRIIVNSVPSVPSVTPVLAVLDGRDARDASLHTSSSGFSEVDLRGYPKCEAICPECGSVCQSAIRGHDYEHCCGSHYWKDGDSRVRLVDSKLSVQEVLEKMRGVFVEGTQDEWVALAIEFGLSQTEAEKLFQDAKGDKLFWIDKDERTVWRWA